VLEVPLFVVADPSGLVAFGVPLTSVDGFEVLGVVDGVVEGDVAVGPTPAPVPFIVVPPVAPTPLVPIEPPLPPTPLVPIEPLVPADPAAPVLVEPAPVEVEELPFTVLVPVVVLVPVAPVVPAVAAGFWPLNVFGLVEVPEVVPTPVWPAVPMVPG